MDPSIFGLTTIEIPERQLNFAHFYCLKIGQKIKLDTNMTCHTCLDSWTCPQYDVLIENTITLTVIRLSAIYRMWSDFQQLDTCQNFHPPMFPGTYVPRYRCSPNLCSPVPMSPGTYVPRNRCSRFGTLIEVISVNRLQIPPRYVRLGLCLGFRFRVLVRVRVRVGLELRSVLRFWLGWVWVGPLRLT